MTIPLRRARARLGSLVALWLVWTPWSQGLTARPDRSFERTVDLELGADSRHIHWGPRRPGPAAAVAPRQDLFVHAGNHVRIWWQDQDGFPAKPNETLRLPSDPGLVDFGDVLGDAGEEVVVLTRRGVFADQARQIRTERSAGAGGIFGDRARATDPGGAFTRLTLSSSGARARGSAGPVPVPFSHVTTSFLRDIDGDGRDDLVVPRQRRYEVYFRRGEAFVPAAFLEARHEVKIDPGGPDVTNPLEFGVEVSELDFKDLNGDGLTDIALSRGSARRFYLQRDDGFPAEPSYQLDLDAFQTSGAEGNSTRPVRRVDVLRDGRARMHEVDIDGDGLVDYLIASGHEARVYFGGMDGVDFSRPHLARRFSGELRGVGSFDIDGDGRLDLVALKFDEPSLPQLIAAYFVSMSVDFEILGYLNQGGRSLSRLPDRKRVITLHLPPIRTVIEDSDAVADRFLAAVASQDRYRAADIDGDGYRDAAFVDEDDTLRVYFGGEGRRETPSVVELGDLFFHPEKREWNLEELLEFIGGAAHAAARERVGDREADLELPLGAGASRRHETLELRDIDGDGTLDFVLMMKGSRLKVILSSG